MSFCQSQGGFTWQSICMCVWGRHTDLVIFWLPSQCRLDNRTARAAGVPERIHIHKIITLQERTPTTYPQWRIKGTQHAAACVRRVPNPHVIVTQFTVVPSTRTLKITNQKDLMLLVLRIYLLSQSASSVRITHSCNILMNLRSYARDSALRLLWACPSFEGAPPEEKFNTMPWTSYSAKLMS